MKKRDTLKEHSAFGALAEVDISKLTVYDGVPCMSDLSSAIDDVFTSLDAIHGLRCMLEFESEVFDSLEYYNVQNYCHEIEQVLLLASIVLADYYDMTKDEEQFIKDICNE